MAWQGRARHFGRPAFLALAAALLAAPASAAQFAVLRVAAGGEQRLRVAALLAEWSSELPRRRTAAAPLVHSASNAQGCARHRRCRGCAVFVLQGGCTFALKAQQAEDAGASLLIVASNKEGAITGMVGGPRRRRRWLVGRWTPRVPALMVSKAAGRRISLSLGRGERLSADFLPRDTFWSEVCSEIATAALAVGLVVLGAFQSVEDLRRPAAPSSHRDDVVVVEGHSGLHFVLFGSTMLVALFFLMRYLIYVLLVVFASGAVSGAVAFLEPPLAALCPSLRRTRAFRLPARLASWMVLAEEHSCSDALAEFAGCALAALFLVYRNDDAYGWLLQNTIATMLLLTIQSTVRLPNLRTGTALLVCTFFFDIFWVFVSPLIFKKSVMIEVATGGGTGQSVPMVLKVPSGLPGQFKILGLGDIALPGLLISMLLRHDLLRRSRRLRGYFVAGLLGYAIGLGATFLSLFLTKHGQPALLFLVPGTLLPTFVIAWRKGELRELWTASYGPEEPPEGYEELADEAAKQD